MISLNTIYNEDCLEGMKRIPDGSVDLIICDLPYGVINRKNAESKWDVPLDMTELWQQYLRIAKPNAAIILFGQGMFTAKLMQSEPKGWRYNLIWQKGNRTTGFLNAKRQPLRAHEDICVFYRKPPTYNPQMTIGQQCHARRTRGTPENRVWGSFKVVPTTFSNEKYPISVLNFNKEHPAVHPTQKPVALLAWLIRTYSNEGDTVLDNCSGSGSTPVACIHTGRNYIAFEVTEKWYNLSQQRTKAAHADMACRIPFAMHTAQP